MSNSPLAPAAVNQFSTRAAAAVNQFSHRAAAAVSQFSARAAAAVNHYSHRAAAAVNSFFIISFFCLFGNYEASKASKPACSFLRQYQIGGMYGRSSVFFYLRPSK